MSILFPGVIAVLFVALLVKSLLTYFRFEKFCRLVATVEGKVAEFDSAEDMDGNSSNPFRRAQFSRILGAGYAGYGNIEIERMAKTIRKDVVITLWVFGLIALLMLVLLAIASNA